MTAPGPRAILYPVMKKYLLFVYAACLLVNIFTAHPAAAFEGPLQTKNLFPLFMHLDTPYLESAATGNSFSSGLSHSSVFVVKDSGGWSADLDMETTELDLKYRREISGLFELGIDLPVISFNSGFMDSFLNSYHKTFGFGDYGRSSRPDNAFLYELKKDGVTVIKGKNGGIGIGDIRLTAKKKLLSNDPVVSVRAEIELPTGSASDGFGSGGFDGGVSILVDKKLGEKFMSYFNVGVVLPGDLKGHESVGLRSYAHGGAGVEAALWEKFSLLGQIYFQTSPFPKTGIGAIDRLSALLSFGGRYSSGSNSFEFSLSEDANTAGAPDVTFNFYYKRRL